MMRPKMHRAVLFRLSLRIAALAALAIAFLALQPAWLGGLDTPLLRAGMLAAAVAVVLGPLALAATRRPRSRATAPRALAERTA